MKAEKVYTKYYLRDGEFMLRVKIGDQITFQNKTKGQSSSMQSAMRHPENTFIFKRSDPELIDKFGKAFRLAAKLAKEDR